MEEFSKKFIIFLILAPLTAFSSIPSVKVKIGSSQGEVTLRGLDLQNLMLGEKTVRQYQGPKKIRFNCRSFKFRKQAKSNSFNPFPLASLQSPTGLITWNSNKYLGKINVLTNSSFSGCDVVNELDLDDYISLLLTKEMSAKWPVEALKAQAIAARTYALEKINSNFMSKVLGRNAYFDLENSEKHQVMGTFFDQTLNTVKATYATKGLVLVNDKKKLLPIFYHSKCGGRTFLPRQIWANRVPGYDSVPCEFCHDHGMKNWKHNISVNKFKNILKKSLVKERANFDKSSTIRMINDESKSPFLRFYLGNDFFKLKKTELRKFFGRKKMPSNNYEIRKNKDKIEIAGAGMGHGVGLCQFGALELAKRGWDYKKILSYYFPSLQIKKYY
jgi:stage II sporulation protein D